MDDYARNRDVDRRFDELSRRIDGAIKDMVTTQVWQQDRDHVRELLASNEARSKERHGEVMKAITEVRSGIAQRSEWTWSRTIGVAAVVIALISALIAAFALTRGIK